MNMVLRFSILGFVLMGFFQSASAQTPVIKLADLGQWTETNNDTLYVLNFWATWCRPCVAEMPYFEKAGEVNADKPVKVVFISLDFVEDLDSRVEPFLKKKQLKSDVVLLDETKYNEWIDLISPDWSGSIPATLFVNHNRQIRKFHEGDFTFEDLNSEIQTLLNQE